VGPTVGLFGFLAQVNMMSAEKLHACTALDISNIWPLKVKICISKQNECEVSKSKMAIEKFQNLLPNTKIKPDPIYKLKTIK
jgi:hypothetical protein